MITSSSEKNVMEQANPLELNNAEVDNVNKQFFEIGLETDTTIKSLATLTLYNWQSADVTNCFAFPTA